MKSTSLASKARPLARATFSFLAFCSAAIPTGLALADEAAQPEPEAPSRDATPLQPGWSLSAFGGYGTDLDIAGRAQEFDVFGAGVGARARYVADFGGLVGARVGHHFGESATSVSLSSALFEIGWAAPLGPLRAEPFAGAGMSRTFTEDSLCSAMTGACETVGGADLALTVGLGLSLVYPFAGSFFAGGSVETLLVVGPSFGVLGYATAGTTL